MWSKSGTISQGLSAIVIYQMNLQGAAFRYVDLIMQCSPGVKAILLDEPSFNILAISATRTELFETEVVMIDKLETVVNQALDPNMAALNCVIICRPDAQNIELISHELDQPHFQKYNLFFTNTVSEAWLRQIASHDSNSVVTSVQEVFLDFGPVCSRLFTLGVEDIRGLRESPAAYSNRIAEGIYAALNSLRLKPTIRYDACSQSCYHVAASLSGLAKASGDLYAGQSSKALVLILDRRTDPVTPLMHMAHFLPMVHDVLGIHNNTVSFGGKTFVLDERSFKFTEKLNVMFIGDVGEAITEETGKLREAENRVSAKSEGEKSASEEMQEKMLAAMKVTSSKEYVAGLTNIVAELFDTMKNEKMMDVSILEQEVVTNGDKQGEFQRVMDMIMDPQVSNMNALRLVLLFALRFEKNADLIGELMDALRNRGGSWSGREFSYWDALKRIAGDGKRGKDNDIFSNKSILGKLGAKLKELKENRSLLELFRPPLETILQKLQKGQLSQTAFPFVDGAESTNVRKVVVFYVGGATYEEFVIASNATSPNLDVIVGGTAIHNAAQFLKYEVEPYI